MDITLADWFKDLSSRSPATVRRPVTVIGTWETRLGARGQYAQIEIGVEPADSWAVAVELPEGAAQKPGTAAYLRSAVFGMLDIFVTRSPRPLLRIRVHIVGMDVHPVDSSEAAFRLAGKDAAQKIILDWQNMT